MSAIADKLAALVDGGSTCFSNTVIATDATNSAYGFGLTPMPIGVVDQICSIPGVAIAVPRVQLFLDPNDSRSGFSAPDLVVGHEAGSDQDHEAFPTEVSRGRSLTIDDGGRRAVLLSLDKRSCW